VGRRRPPEADVILEETLFADGGMTRYPEFAHGG
jgi:hypothetical protein